MMKKTILLPLFLLFISLSGFAQIDTSIYATMSAADAIQFKNQYPEDIQILGSSNLESAVLLTEKGAHLVHDNVLTHGPGYIFKKTEADALAALATVTKQRGTTNFSITEQVLVNECLDLVNANNIETDILDLQNYGTRYHTKPQAVQAVMDQKIKWDAMIAASGRTDVHTRIVNHVNTPMPSVVLTMDGADLPSQFVIIGGHIDSTSYNKNDAPGADDNASGIACLNEIVRVLLAKNFIPSRTIEVMAYAAEEIGLVGSNEIANEYANAGIDVLAYVQFDMTAYKGSVKDIYLMTDYYNSQGVNNYLIDLMDFYNATGPHGFTYGFSQCGYGCSDHASWANYGYETAFPFEAAMGDDNPNIHSPNDTYSFFNTPDHAAKFAKLGLEFLIETAKPKSLGISDFGPAVMDVFVQDGFLKYQLRNSTTAPKELKIFTLTGQQVQTFSLGSDPYGEAALYFLTSGLYIARFELENQFVITRKIIVR